MGWWDKIKAAGTEATKAAREVAEAVSEELEDEFGDQQWYQGVREVGQEVRDLGSELAQEASSFASDTMNSIGQTEEGRYVGEKSSQLARFISSLPLVSIASDFIKAGNGVEGLKAHLMEQPTDPERHLWLAEALWRLERDQKRYTAVRTVMDPSYLVLRQAIKSSTTLGQEPQEPTQRKLLKNAFVLSVGRLRQNRRDAAALHVLSRVYMRMGELGEAARFAKLATLAEPTDGMPLVTLSRVYQALEQEHNTTRAASLAVGRGCTVGHEVLAELLLLQEEASPDRITQYSDMMDKVTDTDRQRYWGPSVRGFDILDTVLNQQAGKAASLFERL